MQIGALDVGGSHVTSAVVEAAAGSTADLRIMPGSTRRESLQPDADAATLLGILGGAMAGPAGRRWGIAMPGPFDYPAGIGRYVGVGKFESLRGVDLRAPLAAAARTDPALLTFLNDADAFALGEWAAGAARGTRRCVGITLGSGIGSGWIVDGVAVHRGVGLPPDGEAHLLTLDGMPLEDRVSRRAIRRAYSRQTGDLQADVQDIARRSRSGDPAAVSVLRAAFLDLGRALAQPISSFGAQALVFGGSIAGSWDLLVGPVREGLGAAADGCRLERSADPDASALIGAARSACSAAQGATS